MSHPLDCIFNPQGVAIIGASQDHTKRGYQAVRALQEAGYEGRIYPVNPKGGELLGLPMAKSVCEIDGDPDLALICTPARTILGVLQDCAKKGIPGAVVLALGFRESGDDGANLEARILDLAHRTGIRLVGPNTSGLLNMTIGLNLIGVREIRPGHLALLMQSGNMGLALMTQAVTKSNLGISICVIVGNETDIAFHEYLEFVANDPHTSGILMYVEGFRDGQRFLEVARRVTPAKPIVLLKGGRSEAGRASAKSHTGAIAGSYSVLRAALKQVGVIEVRRSDELFHVSETLASQPSIKAGVKVTILADGGGQATIAADALRNRGVHLAKLSPETRACLLQILGPAASLSNPVDVAGAADNDPMIFVGCLQALMDDPAVGGVLLVGLFGGYSLRFTERLAPSETDAAREMAAYASRAGKPLVVHSLYAAMSNAPLETLKEAGVPVIESLEVASKCLAASCERGIFLSKRLNGTSTSTNSDWLAAARREGRPALLEPEARRLVARYGIPLVPATLCASAADVIECVAGSSGPVALKVVSAAILHKTDSGGVILNIEDTEAAVSAFHQIRESALAYTTKRGMAHDFRGVLVTPMLPHPVAEVIIGVKRDKQYGLVLMVGLGGIAVEVLRDIAFRVLPITHEDAIEMLNQIKASKLLRGLRGRPGVDREALVKLMLAVADCALANPEMAELELNPVFAYSDTAVAVDVRVFLTNHTK